MTELKSSNGPTLAPRDMDVTFQWMGIGENKRWRGQNGSDPHGCGEPEH